MLVKELIKNSETFEAKTKFSQEKYIMKKMKKYDFKYNRILTSLDFKFMIDIFLKQFP